MRWLDLVVDFKFILHASFVLHTKNVKIGQKSSIRSIVLGAPFGEPPQYGGNV
jgi:hypothetical protein